MASFSRGPIANRPAPSAASATWYWATDTEELSFSTGSVWIIPTEGPLTTQIAQGPQGPPGTTDWNALTNKPSTFAPSSHQHPASDITGLPSGGDSVVKLTGDLAASTSTTLTNTTGLSFAVTSGTLYRFSARIIFRTAALTTGIRIGATTPAFTAYAANVSIPFAIDGSGGVFHGALTTSGDSVVSSAVPAINTDYVATVEGVILPSANGTFQLQHATEVAASAATVRNGSNLTYRTV
jgi:hypothetical protein